MFAEFKKLADKKKEIYDGDVAALIEQRQTEMFDQWLFVNYKVQASSGEPPTVSLTLSRGGENQTATVGEGDGPLDALFRAIEELTATPAVVRDYRVQSATRGKDAVAESVVELECGGQLYRGRGASTDTVEASARAYLNAVNRIAVGEGQPLAEWPDQV